MPPRTTRSAASSCCAESSPRSATPDTGMPRIAIAAAPSGDSRASGHTEDTRIRPASDMRPDSHDRLPRSRTDAEIRAYSSETAGAPRSYTTDSGLLKQPDKHESACDSCGTRALPRPTSRNAAAGSKKGGFTISRDGTIAIAELKRIAEVNSPPRRPSQTWVRKERPMSCIYLPWNASKARQRDAERARQHRAEIVRELSWGRVSRRDLIKMGLFTSAGMLAPIGGLNPFVGNASGQVVPFDIPTGAPRSPLFGVKPFTQPMPRFDVLPRDPISGLTPFPQPEANTTPMLLDEKLTGKPNQYG